MPRPTRTKDTKKSGTTPAWKRGGHSKAEWEAIQAAKVEAERREFILSQRRRTDAKWRPKIPEVRKVANFDAFKNRFHGLDEPDYAVEVLYASPNLQAQIRHEQMLRSKEKQTRDRAKWESSYGGFGGYGGYGYAASRSKKFGGDDGKVKSDEKFNADAFQLQDAYMQRIRIQSQGVLGHITSLMNETEKRSSPRTFMRPFKPLVYFQPKMKEILATLEEKWGDVESLEDVQSEASMVDPDEPAVGFSEASKEADEALQPADDNRHEEDSESLLSVDSNAEEQDLIMDGVEALRDMRCYVEFIDKEVMPLYTQYDGATAQNVRFEDLWSLFRVGDLIQMPNDGDISGRYHEIWRIAQVESPEPDISYPRTYFSDVDNFKKDENKKFEIFAYYVDHDGTEFGAVLHKFHIDSFPDERPIESLEMFPVRFADNSQQLLASAQTQGANFVKYLEPKEKHQTYNAWTLTRNPPANHKDPETEVLKDENDNPCRHPEYIESDVIVDMSEAYQRNSDWRVSFWNPTMNKSSSSRVEEDEMMIQQWIDGTRSKRAFKQEEIVQMTDGIEMRQRREDLETDSFLWARARGSRDRKKTASSYRPKTTLREEDLVLLPKRMFAYVLRERRFVAIDINCLVPVRHEHNVFENLRILKDYKDIVRGLVASHFEKKKIERKYVDRGTEGPSQDLIQGKGRGLVVLLHGVPGVGKTATAEAVAMENKKPLFVVTCGDLGLTPAEVERSLTKMFRLAHMWDCVLLLDEADVFLSQRSHQDMKRNALVSVFLRTLEYYNGILFLTTNRVGSIDEAFKSRIHMSLYYPPLDKAQTRDIFRLNIAKLRQIEAQRHEMTGEPGLQVVEADIVDFASKHYEDNARSSGCWNGRQIRNAFQIASSLAHHKYSEDLALARSRGDRPPSAPVLDRTLFEKVQMSTQSFDRHMMDTKGVDVSLPLRGTFHGEEKY